MYEKTKSAIAKLDALKLRMRPPGAKVTTHYEGSSAERHQYEFEMCEAFEQEAGLPFIEAWHMRKQITAIVDQVERK